MGKTVIFGCPSGWAGRRLPSKLTALSARSSTEARPVGTEGRQKQKAEPQHRQHLFLQKLLLSSR
ncbi:MAG: hypothetical protein JMJ93_02610 [Synergistaceae bacterium]|jgi:hypothetical protein|nr:hypothetical protein [Synergistaceae bacterium]